MKCNSCGGRLEGVMTFCPYCGVRQDIDLRMIHFRDLGTDVSLSCPACTTPLGVIEFATEPVMQIERCDRCLGMFFNPGEMEALLESQTNPLVWLDPAQLRQISTDFGQRREIVYRKCPACKERMSPLNFAGSSGVILDRCGTHGVWLEGGSLRRLMEWWRAGGKLIHHQYELERAKKLYTAAAPAPARPKPGTIGAAASGGGFSSWESAKDSSCLPNLPGYLIDICEILSSLID